MIGIEIKIAGAGEMAQDDLAFSFFPAFFRLLYDGAQGVGRFGGRQDALAAGKGHGGLEDLLLGKGPGFVDIS